MKNFKSQKARDSKQMYSDFSFGRFGYDRNRFKRRYLDSLDSIKDKEHKILFDIGCGRGYWFEIYEGMGFKIENIMGLDQSVNAVKELKHKGYAVCEGDALYLPFSDEVSDVTICNGVIHHTLDSLKAFKELCRITKKDGEIIISVYNIWNPYFLFVHKLPFPIRYIYWNITKSIFAPVYIAAYLVAQVFSLLIFFRLQDKKTIKTLLMDQMFTPVAELFSSGKIRNYGESAGVTVVEKGFHSYRLLRYAKFKK